MSGGIESAANAFSAQSTMYAWLRGIPAAKSRLHFFRTYASSRAQDPVTQKDVDMLFTHMAVESRLLQEGTPVFVTEEAMDLVDEAVEVMPSEVMLHQDLPMDEFVLWLERPIPYHPNVIGPDGETFAEPWNLDAIGIQYKEHAIVVNDDRLHGPPSQRGAYNDALELDEDKLTDGIVLYCYVSHKNLPQPYSYVDYQSWGPYGLIDFIGVGFDVDWADRDIDSPARDLHKWLIALLRLMGEHIELRPTGVGRALRRAAERVGRTIPRDGYLSVVHLRSVYYEQDEAGEPTGRKLRWKHPVRPHWRRFYCSTTGLPVGDPKAYRHRYVNSYVRGPGPLVESNKVVVVDR